MISLLLLLASAQPSPSSHPPETAADGEIVVTASLLPVPAEDAPASVTLIGEETVEALGFTSASDLIRLAPGIAVSTSGAHGALTQVRIRGAEANHTLVFIDGVAFNDVAADNAARFETLTADGLGRLELIRGPQSALWGSEALGGVVAMSTPDPLGRFRAAASAEGGSRDFLRGSAALASGGERAGLSATASWGRSEGIDIIGGGAGDRDGFENLTLSLRGLARFGAFEAGAAGHYIHHDIETDGSDPMTFRRADTLDAAIAETVAARVWLRFGEETSPWSAKAEIQHLDSDNRNRIGAVRTNDTLGRRTRIGGQVARRLGLGDTRHELIAGIEREDEDFGARDRRFGGASDRDLERGRTAFVGEWRAHWGDVLVTDIALRHDGFSRFQDDTTLRAHALLNVGSGLAVLAGYGEGIAQPSFIELFGFAPNSGFIGNPDLRPERSRGVEGGVRWTTPNATMEAVAFSSALRDEILPDFSIFPNNTVVNAPGTSRRRGLELLGEWRPAPSFTVSANYSYVDTRERSTAGAAVLREIRRPKHSANLYADWRSGQLTLGGALSYVGSRIDSDFDLFPAPRVRLGDYVLASARIAYRILPRLEAYARVENGFNADYQDVIGYNTPGRTVYAGLRLRLGD